MVRAPDLSPPPVPTRQTASLFLDFDGTLVDLAPTPDAVRVADHLPALLASLSDALDGRIAVVSGRGAQEVARFLSDPPIVIAGSHGMETRWADGRLDAPAPPRTDALIAEMERFATTRPGVLVERKPFGAALHWRQAAEHEAAAQALAATLAERYGLKLQPGKMVAELRPAGTDKGGAVTALMAQPPMLGTVPLFLGDDVTDEAGFHACASLGGAGILVGEARETAARYRLPDVAATHAWLARLAETADALSPRS